jgi:arginase
MKISLFSVPYDSGRKEERMGLGPGHFLNHGLLESLEALGHEVTLTTLTSDDPFPTEIGTSFDLSRRLSTLVAAAHSAKSFPLVLAGNCGTCLGTLSGVSPSQSTPPGIVWFDAHADFNTPETTGSGFLDGMALAARVGRCWTSLTATVPNFHPTPEQNVILAGVRGIDPAESISLSQSGITVIPAQQILTNGINNSLAPALSALRTRTSTIYLHLDLDVLDPTEAPANQYASLHGLSVSHLEQAISLLSKTFTLSAAALTAYDPTYDPHNLTLHAGLHLAQIVATSATPT